MLGQHNHEILDRLLGLSDDEIAELEADGLIGTPTRSDCEHDDRRRAPCPTCSTAVAVIDVDTHLTEPPDVWTARMPAALHDVVPHIERIDGNDVWMAGGERLGTPGYYSMAGFDGVMPASIPKTFDDIAAVDVRRRRRASRSSTSEGIHAQVLYPNVGGFGNGYFLRLGDRELVARVRARLQRLPHRLVQRRPRPAARRSPRCRSGTSTLAVAELHRCIEPATGR